ncbi:Vomeronasal type-2 receptor 1 [Dissostichus eleginoides]|uniref:Vomeronasal type-2 receptor 1 n=1 Tax=Dissostichus eleginoides TaxID=100907 RepID=A0AAD9FBS0_DISEL|nr:Vomeronasal type-2 receptor 1 [Dissostichus eleginoides]
MINLERKQSLMKASLPPCSGRESLEEVQNHFTDTSQLRVAYNVYLAVYAAAHALHSLLSCPNRDSSSGRNSSCSSSKQIKPFEMSYTASCPCLSDRLQYPNFFRTMPSDIYQARAIAQLAIRLNWTWIGAVIANNDYGHVAIKVFQEETQGAGVCLAFIETLQRENIVMDARQAALTIQASTAKVILIFTWYTDVRELFLQLANINSWGLTTLYEFTVSHRPVVSESFTSTVQRQRVPGGTHALHSLLSCPNRDSSPGNISSTCSSPKQIKPIEVLHHLNNLNFTTPQGEMFYFQEGNTPAKYDLVNWQNTPEGSLKLVLIGRVDGFVINFDHQLFSGTQDPIR